MFKMANVWLSVIVLIFVQNVFAQVCIDREDNNIMNCDVCIRCGGSWCTELSGNTKRHCAFTRSDNFCGGMSEDLMTIPIVESKGKLIFPSYIERTVYVGIYPDSFKFTYASPVERQVHLDIYDTTQSTEDIQLSSEEVKCDGKQCTSLIVAKVGPGFCTSIGSNYEFIYVNIKVDNITEGGLIKYHVPCACDCSKKVEKKSPRCSGHGYFSCGSCSCDADWSGDDCAVLSCKNNENRNRGDVPCTNPLTGVECSGNGKCGPCESCICYDDREGSQYFDPGNFCTDICMSVGECGACLANATRLAPACDRARAGCSHPLTLVAYNDTLVAETDQLNRKVWARCNETYQVTKEEEIYIEYFAMKNENGEIRVMVVTTANKEAWASANETKVPIILGVLVAIAAVAAMAGVVLWKYLSAAPPMPFSSPDYQNIDAEDCVGVNPLYKPPTTTFTNPQFGKC